MQCFDEARVDVDCCDDTDIVAINPVRTLVQLTQIFARAQLIPPHEIERNCRLTPRERNPDRKICRDRRVSACLYSAERWGFSHPP